MKQNRRIGFLLTFWISTSNISKSKIEESVDRTIRLVVKKDGSKYHFLGQGIFNEYSEQFEQKVSMSLIDRKSQNLEESLEEWLFVGQRHATTVSPPVLLHYWSIDEESRLHREKWGSLFSVLFSIMQNIYYTWPRFRLPFWFCTNSNYYLFGKWTFCITYLSLFTF